MPLSPTATRELLTRLGHQPKRFLGQNFLVDGNIVRKSLDLAVFTTDLGLSERLIPQFPAGVIAVSESGIHGPAEAARARSAGAHAILVGEALMRTPDTADFSGGATTGTPLPSRRATTSSTSAGSTMPRAA